MTAKIKLNAASGGGSISIQAPSSSSNNRVISLPDIADGTLVTSQSTLDATKLSGNLPAISGAALTGISAGITALNVWYLTSDFSGNSDPVQNWAKYSDKGNTGGFGSDMTESSGIWTFPSTGFLQVHCQAYAWGSTSTASYSIHSVISTDSGSNYGTNPRRSFSNIPNLSGTWYGQNSNTFYYDVTNISTTRLKVVVDGSPPNINTGGTFVRFIRLADT